LVLGPLIHGLFCFGIQRIKLAENFRLAEMTLFDAPAEESAAVIDDMAVF